MGVAGLEIVAIPEYCISDARIDMLSARGTILRRLMY